MKWITRERPKIDRIACPWLIKNFVDSHAEFIYVPKEAVFKEAKELMRYLTIFPERNIHMRGNAAPLIISLENTA
jgi:hypothetical protein